MNITAATLEGDLMSALQPLVVILLRAVTSHRTNEHVSAGLLIIRTDT